MDPHKGSYIIPFLPKKYLLGRISLQLPVAAYCELSVMRQEGKNILLPLHPALQLFQKKAASQPELLPFTGLFVPHCAVSEIWKAALEI